MTTRYNTQAIIFKKRDLNESDRMFSVFTNNFGQLDIFAKAIRKSSSKLRGGMDIFLLSEIEFIEGKNRKTLTDATSLERFNNIAISPEKFNVANRVSDIIHRFVKGAERDSSLFDLLNDSFYKLNDDALKKKKAFLVFYYFLWNALSLLGYHCEVKKCANCVNKLMPHDIYFSAKEGGVICGNCFKKAPQHADKINSSTVKILRIIFSKNWNLLLKLKMEKIDKILLGKISQRTIDFFCLSH